MIDSSIESLTTSCPDINLTFILNQSSHMVIDSSIESATTSPGVVTDEMKSKTHGFEPVTGKPK